MEHEGTPDNNPDDEEPSSSSWLHPDDRLWRHPSEVRANPPIAPARREAWLKRFALSASTRTWSVGVISGLIAALATIGVLAATGEIGAPQTVLRTSNTVKPPVATGAHAPTSVPNVVAPLGAVDPSIVGVNVNGSNGVEAGSGVIVPPIVGDESYIVTAASLFADAGTNSQVQVTTDWGSTVAAQIVGSVPGSGITLLKAVLAPLKDVQTASLGSVANIQTGEQVFAVGSPAEAASDNASNFATGYINDTLSFFEPVNGSSNATFSMLVANLDLPQGSPNYGGAIVDSSGNVLGIIDNVQGASEGLSYIAPIDTVMAEVTGLIKDGQAGAYPWLGLLQATDLSGSAAQSLRLTAGVEVEAIASGSPMARVGVRDYDIVSSLDGNALPSVGALVEWLANARPGQVVSIGWWHDGRRHSAVLTLGSQPLSATAS